ncbi:RNA polymerase sigma factor [Carnobacterium maltaromaticum]|uniref:RNA polymerase sigma factor n=1 Tax=Carnobacterium maltaromaticum TaxID=2751 RepID=UPI0039BE9CA9
MKDADKDYQKMENLYQYFEQKAYYTAYSILNNVQQAEDAVQETFITLYQNIATIHGLDDQETKRYILRIVKNKAIDSYRKNKRHILFMEDYQNKLATESLEEQENYILSEVQIDQLLLTLTSSYKQVFKYKVFYNLTYQEIAELMGLSESTVRKQFERTRKQILNLIGGSQNDEFKEFKRH